MGTFSKRSEFPVSVEELWAWHMRPGALQRLSPPFEGAEVEEQFDEMKIGARTVLRVGVGPARLRWVAEITDVRAPERFEDTQLSGPFSKWVHSHEFQALGADRSVLNDVIHYELPLGGLGRLVASAPIRGKIERMFAYRHETTLRDLNRHRRFSQHPRRTVVISGASGLLGSALSAFLTTGGHQVKRLVRRTSSGSDDIHWDIAQGQIDTAALEGVDAVIHLAGESVAGGRWSEERKAEILNSREKGTALLAEACAKLKSPPKVFISGSAVGLYGDQGDTVLDESAASGEGFLAEVCRRWEAAAHPLHAAGIRTVNLRLGVVLSAAGGALKTMLPPFKMGLGGRMGSGEQWFPWVAMEDVLGAIHWALFTESVRGPVNLVSPQIVRQKEFASVLGKVLSRPAVAPLPSAAIRTAMGDMGKEMLLFSQNVTPRALLNSGYQFESPSLEDSLRLTLGR